MGAWYTTASSANLITTRSITAEYQNAGISYMPVLQRRFVMTTTNNYIGIDVGSATSIVNALSLEADVVSCLHSEPTGGSVTVTQVKQTTGPWVTVA